MALKLTTIAAVAAAAAILAVAAVLMMVVVAPKHDDSLMKRIELFLKRCLFCFGQTNDLMMKMSRKMSTTTLLLPFSRMMERV